MIESYATRRGAIGWLVRRGLQQRRGELVTVTKVSVGQTEREADVASRYRRGAR